MKKLPLFKTGLILLFISAISSCKKEDEKKAEQTVQFKAVYTTNKASDVNAANVILSSFIVNVSQVEFDYDDDAYDNDQNSVISDHELKGPFEINLLKDGNALQKTISKTVNIPFAAYDEIEFEFDYNENPNSAILGKSIEIKGTIDGKPFIFWTNEEFEIEKEFDNPIVINENTSKTFTIQFNLSNLFNPIAGGVNLSNAKDGDDDGIIEIYPDNLDGNNELYDVIEDAIWDIIDAQMD